VTVPPVSIIVLTLNVEADLHGCHDSLTGWYDIHVLKSGSTDRTAEVARDHGVSASEKPFHGFGQQRNWAINHVSTCHTWQLNLDVDKRRELASGPDGGAHGP
jgi:glycosyltransferase involved in cell wall biosynthesis